MAALANSTNTKTSTASRAELEAKTMPELKLMCKAANVPVTGKKEALVGFLLDPSNNQKGKRKVGGAPGGQSKAAKAARAMAGPWSDAGDVDGGDQELVDPARAEAELRGYVKTCANWVDRDWHDSYMPGSGSSLHHCMWSS